jgi:hypothetical protein
MLTVRVELPTDFWWSSCLLLPKAALNWDTVSAVDGSDLRPTCSDGAAVIEPQRFHACERLTDSTHGCASLATSAEAVLRRHAGHYSGDVALD